MCKKSGLFFLVVALLAGYGHSAKGAELSSSKHPGLPPIEQVMHVQAAKGALLSITYHEGGTLTMVIDADAYRAPGKWEWRDSDTFCFTIFTTGSPVESCKKGGALIGTPIPPRASAGR